MTGKNDVPLLVWLVPHTMGFCFDPAVYSGLGITGASKDARILVNVVKAKGAKNIEQFPATLRKWEVGGKLKEQVRSVTEATRAQAQSTLDANEKKKPKGSGGAA